MEKQVFLIFGLIAIYVAQAAVFRKVVVDDKDALCLDGSQGVYYLS